MTEYGYNARNVFILEQRVIRLETVLEELLYCLAEDGTLEASDKDELLQCLEGVT